MNMFNLIISPDNERANHLIIEPYDSVFGLESYGSLLEDPSFNNASLEYFTTTSPGITALASGDYMRIESDGTQIDSSFGALGSNMFFIDGGRYTLAVDIKNIAPGNSVTARIENGSNYSLELVANSTGVFSGSFIFDKSDNGGSDYARLRVAMTDGVGNAYNVNINSIDLTGAVYNTIIKKDWSNKVDMDSFDMKMMDLSEKVEFSCVKDKDDYSSNKLSNHVATAGGKPYNYGDLNYVATDYTNLSGVDEIKNLLFASTVVKKIGDIAALSTFITPAIYKGEDDGNFTFYKSKPRILFDNGVKTTSSTFTSPTPSQNDGLTGFTNQSEYLLFTHFSDFDLLSGASATCQDYNWTDCYSFVDNYSVNNLFNEYWSAYYNELYHPDTRMYTVECLLNHNDISNFKFNDVIVIENSEFRVNNISYNSEGLSKVELIKLP